VVVQEMMFTAEMTKFFKFAVVIQKPTENLREWFERFLYRQYRSRSMAAD